MWLLLTYQLAHLVARYERADSLMVIYLLPILFYWLFNVLDHLSLILVLCSCLVFCWARFFSGFSNNSLLSCLSQFLWVLSLIYFSTSSLFVLFVCFEFSIYPLVAVLLFFGYQPEKLVSSLYFLVYTVVGGLPLIYFVGLNLCCSIYSGLRAGETLLFLSCLAFFIKSPLYFFHS